MQLELMTLLARLSHMERRLLARLWHAGAVSPASAHPLPALSRAPAGWRARLVASGLLVEAAEHRAYLNSPVYRGALMWWRLTLAVGVLAIAAVGFWRLSAWRRTAPPGADRRAGWPGAGSAGILGTRVMRIHWLGNPSRQPSSLIPVSAP